MSVRLDEWMELETYDSKRVSFPDVPGSHWAADYIQEATGMVGLWVTRTDCSTAGTDHPAPRCAAIVNRMLGRAADERFIRHNEDELTTFRDLQNPHYWGLLRSPDGGRHTPHHPTTRRTRPGMK
ncbi:MAG: hypothetical protein ACLRX2_12245 [Oscillospiraceae bacterium]